MSTVACRAAVLARHDSIEQDQRCRRLQRRGPLWDRYHHITKDSDLGWLGGWAQQFGCLSDWCH